MGSGMGLETVWSGTLTVPMIVTRRRSENESRLPVTCVETQPRN